MSDIDPIFNDLNIDPIFNDLEWLCDDFVEALDLYDDLENLEQSRNLHLIYDSYCKDNNNAFNGQDLVEFANALRKAKTVTTTTQYSPPLRTKRKAAEKAALEDLKADAKKKNRLVAETFIVQSVVENE